MQLAGLALFARGVILIARGAPSARCILVLLFGLPAGLWLLSLASSRIYIERSLLVLLPFFYMALARGAVGFRAVGNARRRDCRRGLDRRSAGGVAGQGR